MNWRGLFSWSESTYRKRWCVFARGLSHPSCIFYAPSANPVPRSAPTVPQNVSGDIGSGESDGRVGNEVKEIKVLHTRKATSFKEHEW